MEQLPATRGSHELQKFIYSRSELLSQAKGVVPLDNPGAPNKTRCAVLDGATYGYQMSA